MFVFTHICHIFVVVVVVAVASFAAHTSRNISDSFDVEGDSQTHTHTNMQAHYRIDCALVWPQLILQLYCAHVPADQDRHPAHSRASARVPDRSHLLVGVTLRLPPIAVAPWSINNSIRLTPSSILVCVVVCYVDAVEHTRHDVTHTQTHTILDPVFRLMFQQNSFHFNCPVLF